MRELRLVGPGSDGRSLVVELDGEQLRVGVPRAVVAAAAEAPGPVLAEAGAVPPGPLPSPAEIQRRIRGGESAAQVAAASGLEPRRVERYAGPPLAERDHQARLARAAVLDAGSLDAATLEERVLAYAGATAVADPARGTAPPEPTWDAWLGDDGDWRVVAVLPEGPAACWSWRPAAARLTPVERTARLITPGLAGAGGDVLQAVLRPVGAPPAGVPPVPPAGPEGGGPAAPAPRRGRASVPSWEEISGTTTRTEP